MSELILDRRGHCVGCPPCLEHHGTTHCPRHAKYIAFKRNERETAARLMLGPDNVALHRETVLQIEELFEMLIHMGDGTQEDADILDDIKYVGRDAFNILPHIKLALARGETADD